jgi:PadR family transcriptional regulator, regulatory protein AphA
MDYKMSRVPSRVAEEVRALTTTEGVVLGLLSEGTRSGYDLLKRAEQSVGHMWAPAKSQLYAVLPRLVGDGLATRKKVPGDGRPDKHVYRLTAAGRRTVRSWLEHAPARTWDELLLKVFFAKLVPRKSLLRHLESHRELQRAVLAEYESISPATPHGALTLRYGLALVPLRIAWIDDALEELSR